MIQFVVISQQYLKKIKERKERGKERSLRVFPSWLSLVDYCFSLIKLDGLLHNFPLKSVVLLLVCKDYES